MMHSFSFPLDETLTLRGDLHLSDDAKEQRPVLVFCHGFKGFKDWGSFPYAAEQLAKRGIAVIRINFSCNGVGESLTEFDEPEKFAVNTYARELADLSALLRWLNDDQLPASASLDKERLFVLGHSKGGGDAILFGANNPQVRGIVTWNGIANVNLFDAKLRAEIAQNGVGYILNGRTQQQMPISKVVIEDVDQNADAYDLLAKVSAMPQPLLIVQGDEDAVRLINGARQLHDAAPNSRLHWIEGAGHTFNTVHPFAGTTPQLEEAIDVTAQFVLDHSR
ncbi:alpha/beta fold hydrolase [Brevibacillus humidisoli]|uniref:alpha/beta hydrolase n=1 Tax=Brevibacillus humidisoli TaxID=2895522 RepID=UPI001E4B81B7|nr:alpha/beta hydrolase [Brevibacillus humidisoli]UFJ39428.1 alpha/beta fold hydrolase [Brevibacillus humidisoli]